MVDQASVRNANTPGQTNGQGVVGSITTFGNDVFTLAELQAKLAVVDLKDSADRVVVPLIAVLSAAVFGLAAIPVGLFGIADLVTRALGVTPGVGMLLTAFFALVIAALIGFAFFRQLSSSLEPLRRSREELVRNIAWIRTVLVHSGRSTPRRGS